MIEIADASEVSRATLYNHYRDKNAVLMALITAEVERLVEAAQRAGLLQMRSNSYRARFQQIPPCRRCVLTTKVC